MDDPSPPAKCAIPQQLLQQQRQRQQQQQLLFLQQYQRLMMQQQHRIHQQQSQGPPPQDNLPRQLQEPQQQHVHDQLKQPEHRQQYQHFQQSQQQLSAMSLLPTSIDTNPQSSGVRSIQFLQQQTQQQTVQPPTLAPPQPYPLQGVGAGDASVATAPQPFRSKEVDMVREDTSMVCSPEVEKPFSSVEDAVHRLLPYHILADYEAEENDRILDTDTTGKVTSRLQQWDQNIVTKMEEFTSAFEKQVQDFNSITQKHAAGEFQSEERLMLERALLVEEQQAMLQLRAELEVRDRLEKELAEANFRMAIAVGPQARDKLNAATVSNRVGENSHYVLGIGSVGHQGEAVAAGWDSSGQVQGRDLLDNYSWRVEVAQSNLHTSVAQIDQTQAMIHIPATTNPGLVPRSECFGQTRDSIVNWNSINQGERRDPSANENRDSMVLLGQWRDAGMLNTK